MDCVTLSVFKRRHKCSQAKFLFFRTLLSTINNRTTQKLWRDFLAFSGKKRVLPFNLILHGSGVNTWALIIRLSSCKQVSGKFLKTDAENVNPSGDESDSNSEGNLSFDSQLGYSPFWGFSPSLLLVLIVPSDNFPH